MVAGEAIVEELDVNRRYFVVLLISGILLVAIIPLVAHIWMSPLFGTIVLSHMILVIFLAISSIQGMRKFR